MGLYVVAENLFCDPFPGTLHTAPTIGTLHGLTAEQAPRSVTILSAISLLSLLFATGWALRLVWRSRDWRLGFLPMMVGVLALKMLFPSPGKAESLILELSTLTVTVVTVFYFLFRQYLRTWGSRALRAVLGLIILYEIAWVVAGESLFGPELPHEKLSVNLVLCLTLVLLGRIVDERKEVEVKLRDESLHDALTGLPNRTLFMERLRRAHARSRAQRGSYSFAVLFLDLDRFKLLNDTLGHSVGDVFLVQTALRLQASVRQKDVVARVGGDEFAILLHHLSDVAEAKRLARRLLDLLAVPHALDAQELFTTASIGISLSKLGYERPEDMVRDADTAMCRAKAAGQGQFEIFESTMHEDGRLQLELEAGLRRAVEDQDLLLYYQPIAAADSGEITGCEALLRWKHSERGLVCPAEFLPVAEQTGLILPIGEWVVRTACRQVKTWQTANLPVLRLSINVSPRQLSQEGFTHAVRQALEETGLQSSLLQLEFPEVVFLEDSDPILKVLNELADLGIRIAVDDTGAGHSSANYLRRFRVHTLKIDRSFVNDLSKGDPGSPEVLRVLITQAKSLGLEVIAEGVESEDQVSLLRSLGCDQMQGFLFSHPLPAGEFGEFLRKSKTQPFRGLGLTRRQQPSQRRLFSPEISTP